MYAARQLVCDELAVCDQHPQQAHSSASMPLYSIHVSP